ncbi:MAG: hypothetical protein GF331_11825 [Chitinivibrionales bacterium]|nr:hypothetical protein [Chitinivibrionales bacterium]
MKGDAHLQTNSDCPMHNETPTDQTSASSAPPTAMTVHSDVLRGLYAATLLELPPEQVIEFWRAHIPAYLADEPVEWRRFDKLLTGREPTDHIALNATFDAFGSYLCENGRDPLAFVLETMVKVNRGLPVSPGLLLKACAGFIRSLVHTHDMRGFIVEHLQDFAVTITGGVGHRRLCHRVQDDWATDLVGVWGPVSEEQVVGEWKLPPYDCALWTMALVAMSPVYLGLPKFEESYMLCDTRDIATVLPGSTPEHVDQAILVNGRSVASVLSWKTFRDRHGLPDDCPGDDSVPVAVVLSAVTCPGCGRTLLHEGCAYGAPLYVYGLHYRRLHQELSEPVFSRMVGEALQGRLLNREVRRRQESVLERLRRKLMVVYHPSDESISVDGRHLVRSTPAKMLRRMVRTYVDTGRNEFEYREFCRDDSMVIDPASPNISVRVLRLVKTLEAVSDGLRVARIARGRLRLEPRYPVEYCEES